MSGSFLTLRLHSVAWRYTRDYDEFVSEQRFFELRVRFQSERARHGFYRAAVVFSWRRAKRAVRFGAEDAAVWFVGWRQAQRVQSAVVTGQTIQEFADSTARWGCSVIV